MTACLLKRVTVSQSPFAPLVFKKKFRCLKNYLIYLSPNSLYCRNNLQGKLDIYDLAVRREQNINEKKMNDCFRQRVARLKLANTQNHVLELT